MGELKKECEGSCIGLFDTSFANPNDFEKGKNTLSNYLQKNRLESNILLSRALKRTASNFNFSRKPNKRSNKITIQDTTSIEPIGRLEVESNGNKVNVFCRGRKIGLPNTKQNIELLEYINKHKSMTMQALYDSVKLDWGFLERFVKTLYAYKGINLIENKECL